MKRKDFILTWNPKGKHIYFLSLLKLFTVSLSTKFGLVKKYKKNQRRVISSNFTSVMLQHLHFLPSLGNQEEQCLLASFCISPVQKETFQRRRAVFLWMIMTVADTTLAANCETPQSILLLFSHDTPGPWASVVGSCLAVHC